MVNLVCDRKAAAQALQVLSGVVLRKTMIPAITHVKVSANGAIDLAGTDLDQTLVWSLPRTGGTGEASLLLPWERFSKYVKGAPGEALEISWESPLQATLDGAVTMVGLEPQDFPTLPAVSGKKVARVGVQELAARLGEVECARSLEVVRYALTGVLFEVKKGKRWKPGPFGQSKKVSAHVVTSDGKRLAVRSVSVQETIESCRIILREGAAETIRKIARALRAEPELCFDVTVEGDAEGETRARVHFVVPGRVHLTASLIDGHFPDWEAVVPAIEKKVTLSRDGLREALKKVEPALTEKTMAVKFTFAAGILTLKAKSQDVGEATATMPYSGTFEAEAVYNPLYVSDFLASLPKGKDSFELRIERKDYASLWHGEKGHTYVLMPLTINL